MDFEPKLTLDDIPEMRAELFEAAEAGGGHYFYRQIRERLEDLMLDVNTKQINELTLEIMKTYSNRPALIAELEQILGKKQKVEFAEWQKTHPVKRQKVKCPNCGHNSVVRIVYGMPGDESTFLAADQKKIIIGGCMPTDNRYGCTNCDARFQHRPAAG